MAIDAVDSISIDGTSINANGVLSLTSGEVTQLATIGATTISETQWGYLGAADQGIAKATTVQFAGVNSNAFQNVSSGNILFNIANASAHTNIDFRNIDITYKTSLKVNNIEVVSTGNNLTAGDGTNGSIKLGADVFAQNLAGVVSIFGIDAIDTTTKNTLKATEFVTNKAASGDALLADAHKKVVFGNGANDWTYTVQPVATIAHVTGTVIALQKTGSGEITVARGAGVAFNGALGDANFKIDGATGDVVVYIELSETANTWRVIGNVKAV